VAALTSRDAERVLRFVADAEELGGDEPFTPEVLVELGKLIEADQVGYCELDCVRRRELHGVARTGDPIVELEVDYWEFEDEEPICSHRSRNGDFRALKLSDFVSLKELHKSRIYALWTRPWGVERELSVAIPSPPWHAKNFLFDRGQGPDFTERDRLVLDLLQPHLGRLWRAARTRRQLRVALESVDGGSEQGAHGVILLGSGGLIELASPAARRLLREYFGAKGHVEAPIELVEWHESGSSTLVRGRGEHRLTVSHSGTTLLLEETRDELGLTARERQVLAWVARGKRNSEVAEILWVTPSTVRKHLENAYAKLGVHTRTAAVTRFLGILERE
jgi:DNA-binding CsgD family transcriptional regulator